MQAIIVQEGSAQEIAGLALALQGQQPLPSTEESVEQFHKSLTKSMELKSDYQL